MNDIIVPYYYCGPVVQRVNPMPLSTEGPGFEYGRKKKKTYDTRYCFFVAFCRLGKAHVGERGRERESKYLANPMKVGERRERSAEPNQCLIEIQGRHEPGGAGGGMKPHHRGHGSPRKLSIWRYHNECHEKKKRKKKRRH